MIVGFTGTQFGASTRQVVNLKFELSKLGCTELHHGDCVGADAQAHAVALELGIPVVLHPPINMVKRAFCQGAMRCEEARHYLDRNQKIVDDVDILIACPFSPREMRRSGTWSTVRYARRIGREVKLLPP